MFKVGYSDGWSEYFELTVYEIKDCDIAGIHFLVYLRGKWVWVNSNLCTPIEEIE